MKTSAVFAEIQGIVQGVGYRAWVQHTASKHGLSGWVRNRRDGCVEAVFVGQPEAVDAMLELLKRGPRLAEVQNVQTRPARADEIPTTQSGGFAIVRDA